jgi:hypothetical protein
VSVTWAQRLRIDIPGEKFIVWGDSDLMDVELEQTGHHNKTEASNAYYDSNYWILEMGNGTVCDL